MPGVVGCHTIIINDVSAAIPVQESDDERQPSGGGGYCNISVVREITQRVVLPYVACSSDPTSGGVPTDLNTRRTQLLVRGEHPTPYHIQQTEI
jgi:hypothetical protein